MDLFTIQKYSQFGSVERTHSILTVTPVQPWLARRVAWRIRWPSFQTHHWKPTRYLSSKAGPNLKKIHQGHNVTLKSYDPHGWALTERLSQWALFKWLRIQAAAWIVLDSEPCPFTDGGDDEAKNGQWTRATAGRLLKLWD
ncbi:hypothetical protein S40285_10473 [Stachybotrys chlorohalonatus IBT 40285]|uniref:Uncharacterized protein n=1 Tax=Stachybotrys chlorohalonatus (strain IBT 40285) TaxID=1283841 RepID=A0A084QME8_STAC4|nr:hypothetical protein S40285_10473 [Stachybotrys chlorohalonata IBT 40285]